MRICARQSCNQKTEKNEDYFTINAKGAVPALLLDEGVLITENAVIQQYLADTYDTGHRLLPAIGNIKRYQILSWLNYVSTELHKTAAPLFNSKISQELKTEIFIPAFRQKLEFLNHHLESHSHLFGDQVTLADFYAFTVLTWCAHFNVNLADYPNVKRYFDAMKELPSVKAALQEENLTVK